MAAQRQPRMRLFALSADPVAMCVGKTRWASEESAQRAASRIKRESPDRMSSTVRPYRCPFGRNTHWHIGHGA